MLRRDITILDFIKLTVKQIRAANANTHRPREVTDIFRRALV